MEGSQVPTGTPNPTAEHVEFQGVTYHRYPDSPHPHARRYFISPSKKATDRLLHRAIWMAAHGPIPPKHHIHHIDYNPLNNDLSNLQCLPHGEHSRMHIKITHDLRECTCEVCEKVFTAKAPAKHCSSHCTYMAAKARPTNLEPRICETCGEPFDGYKYYDTRHCSARCAARRDRRRTGWEGLLDAILLST
jgi:hypothetical protein